MSSASSSINLSSETSRHLRRLSSFKATRTEILYTQVVNWLRPSKVSNPFSTRNKASCTVSSIKGSNSGFSGDNHLAIPLGKARSNNARTSASAASRCAPAARRSLNQVWLSRAFVITFVKGKETLSDGNCSLGYLSYDLINFFEG